MTPPYLLARSVRVHNLRPIGGAVAQLGERLVRNEEVVGSIPISSTIFPTECIRLALTVYG